MKKGFTLIELMLYTAIAATMTLAIGGFVALTYQSKSKNLAIVEVEEQGLLAMSTIAQKVRNATVINSPTIGVSSATLSVGSSDSSKNPSIFNLAGNQLVIKEGTGAQIPLSNSHVTVSNLNFQNLSYAGTRGIIKITFTLSYNNPSGRGEYSYTKTFTDSASLR